MKFIFIGIYSAVALSKEIDSQATEDNKPLD